MTDAYKTTYKQLVYPALGACQEVHKHLGPFLNEYMYQDALAIELSLRGIPFQRGPQRKPNEVFAMGRAGSSEYFLPKRNFGTCTRIDHAKCKAVDNLTDAHRQQLWNYMRLTGINLGVLYNFAPTFAKCEKYCYIPETSRMVAF
jgi:hypothetical protein